jgi:hypothetical protein
MSFSGGFELPVVIGVPTADILYVLISVELVGHFV